MSKRHHRAVLTVAQVRSAKKELAKPDGQRKSINEIARSKNISPSAIKAIRDGRTWKDV